MVRLTIRVDFEPGHALGPGKVRLLEQIEEAGSIRGAASALKMSYRRAWLLLQALEKTFGAPLIETATGGAKGGGAALTGSGKKVVRLYREMERRAATATATQAKALVHSRYSKVKKLRKAYKKR
ncbi:MAG: LysR family transcriptional regulator [Proteobacteria bacterium]|nr:LysR family transcriptional regulator [Pseudomonadota bacterium]